MAKRSTRRMRGGFLEGIIGLFTGEKKPVLPVTTGNVNKTAAQSTPPSNNKPVIVPMGTGATAERQPGSTMFNPDPKVPSAFGGARRRRRSTRRKARTIKRKASRKASRKARRSSSRKSRRSSSRKH